jgi:hypothetical protein
MFQEQQVSVSDEPPNVPRRLPRGRRAKERAEYERRKTAGECTRCQADVRALDNQLCGPCREYAKVKTAASTKRLRANRRLKKQCARCGGPSPDRYECARCSGVNPTVNPHARSRHSVIHAARTRAVTEGDGRTRNRGVGRGKRGHPSRADEDAWCLRTLQKEIGLAVAAVEASHSPAVALLPRFQRDAVVQDALSHLELLERQLEELVDRLKRRLR